MKMTTRISTIPPVRVSKQVRTAAESTLGKGETLSSFVLESIQLNIQRRNWQSKFVAHGLVARGEARRTGKYISADEVLAGLDKTLARKRVVRK